LIITEGNKRVIIDGGGSDNDEYDIGESVLVPYLLDRKIITIDYMIFSHFDSDHCKGLEYT
jgi:competence protein ComEC